MSGERNLAIYGYLKKNSINNKHGLSLIMIIQPHRTARYNIILSLIITGIIPHPLLQTITHENIGIASFFFNTLMSYAASTLKLNCFK